MPGCPYPGPPCYTLKSTTSGESNHFQSTANIETYKVTDIGWEQKYFKNPILSTEKIEVRIFDINKSKILVEFKEVTGKDNLLSLQGVYCYAPNQLGNLRGEKIVVYELKDSEGTHEFKIQIL